MRLQSLLEPGRRRGWLEYEDLDAVLPPAYETGPELDAVLSVLEQAGIELRLGGEPEQEPTLPPSPDDPFYMDNPIAVYLREVRTVPPISREEEQALAQAIRSGGAEAERARKRLIEANLWMVVAVARRYPRGSVHLLDLIQEGNTALLRAADSWDSARGYAFTPYATWLVRRALREPPAGEARS